MSKTVNAWKKASTRQTVNIDDLLNTIKDTLDGHEGEEHVSAIEGLFSPAAIKVLKEHELLEADRYYSPRQAAAAMWLIWRSM